MSHLDHLNSPQMSTRCAILTISDTRTKTTDHSGQAIVELLSAQGHNVISTAIIPDDLNQIRSTVEMYLADSNIQVIITTGGTGISSRDQTYEAVTGMLSKNVEGFGELFRWLSYQEIGSAAMLGRAIAGTAQGKIVFCIPGSENAVRLAMTKLILPELEHLVREVSR